MHVVRHLQANGLRDVGACGHAVANAQTMVFVRGQVVENQRSVQRTARRDYTSPFFVLAECFPGLTVTPQLAVRVASMARHLVPTTLTDTVTHRREK